MPFDFIDMVMEAKGKKAIRIVPDEEDQTDYTDEDDTDEGTSNDDEADATEYTEEDEDADDDEEPTDYTEEDDESTEDEDDEETSDGDDEATDYTDSEEEIDDDATDYTETEGEESDETLDDEQSGTEEDSDEPTSDERKNKALLEDLINLKEIVVNFIDKTTSIKGKDLSKINLTNQVTNNLTQLSKQLHSYIIYRFSKETYVRNLYFYNNSVEALNICINMLRKINSFKHNK